jgi:hypothetical protein
MDSKPLVIEQTDAGAELVNKLRTCLPVEAAFWLNPSEEGGWALYIVSPEIDKNNFDFAYGEAIRIAHSMKTPYLDPFQIRIIRVSDPLAQAAIAANQKYPGSTATRFWAKMFGGVSAEEVFIYPSQPVAASS